MNALEQNIMEALAGNPRVDPDEISVGEAFGGAVILRGTVGSVVQREESVRTTRHVTGAKSVTDRLRLGLRGRDRRSAAWVSPTVKWPDDDRPAIRTPRRRGTRAAGAGSASPIPRRRGDTRSA